MINLLRVLAALLMAALMTACGGGGGSPGTTAGGGTGGTGGTGGGGTTGTPTLTLSIVTSTGATTSTVSLSATTFARVVVTDAAGAKVSGAVVSFGGGSGLVSFVPSTGSALTDANGVAQVQILAAASAGGAGSISASSTVGTTPVSASTTFQVPAGSAATTPKLTLDLVTGTGTATSTVSLSASTYARVVLTDAAGAKVSGAVVTFTGGSGLVAFVPASGSALTDSNGVATVQVQAVSSAGGAGTVSASSTVGTTAVSATANFQVPAGSATTAPKLTLNLVTSTGASTTTVSLSAVTSLRAVVTDAAGAKVSGAVVVFSGGSGLVSMVPSSGTALTDSNGVASVVVQPASTTSAGAGVLSAASSVGSTGVSASVSFQVPQTVSDSPSARVSNFVMLLDRTTLSNGGTTTAKITVVAVDSSNNVVSGATVVVSTDKNSIYTPTSGNTTDGSGQYTGQIGFGTDKTDRVITATVVINGITKSTSVSVVGSKITLQSTPASPSPGQAVATKATLTDSTGNPISGVTLRFGGTVSGVQNQTAVTNVDGQATIAFLAPSIAGTYTVNATGNGVGSGDYQLQVFSSTIPVATIPSGVTPSLALSPNVLAVNTPGGTTNRSNIRFLILDSSNNPISNVRVRFEDKTTGLPLVGASITSGTATLYTDASGTATAQYIAGQNSSPTNGVLIRACYKATDFTSTSDCPTSVAATLTVAGQALAVSIGDDNSLQTGSGTYIKRLTLTVADSAGRAVPNAPVDISVDLPHFGKGLFIQPITFPPTDLNAYYPVSPDAVPDDTAGRSWCRNEDLNRNGSVDLGENINHSIDTSGQETLEPRKSDLIISYADPAVTTTNASGILLIKVEYSQRFATWLAYRVRATANVAGSQGMAERLFVTKYLDVDASSGSFLTPPYGAGACSSPN